MSNFAYLLICFQVCLVQNVYSQYVGAGSIGYGPAIAPHLAPYGLSSAPFGVAPMAVELGGYGAGCPTAIEVGGYGGSGVGEVAVVGEIPVAGTTLVAGQVPILGAVRFAGDLPATGTVTITGSCGCGCGHGPYYY